LTKVTIRNTRAVATSIQAVSPVSTGSKIVGAIFEGAALVIVSEDKFEFVSFCAVAKQTRNKMNTMV
jgi:hypothetical protein